MKKFVALVTLAVMSLALLAGCGDPVYDDFTNYLNVEMTEVNENYDKITEEASKWESFEEDAELEASLNDILLPLVNDSIKKLENINPQTQEVKDLKAKYVKVMVAYKEGFEKVLEGVREVDEDIIFEGNNKITEGMDFLTEYNQALEELAEQYGAEIEY